MRKSELGNLVAANMADIMESEEHRSLFRKQAKSEEETPKCKCPKDCECKEDGECPDKCPCAKKKEKKEDDASAEDSCKCKCVTCKNGKCAGAKCTHGKKDDDASADDECKCSDACPCNDGGECNECAVTAKFNGLFESVLKMSETLDGLGFSKSASSMIKVADELLVEAAGEDTIEGMMKENPDLDVDVAVVKEKPAAEGGELFDPRLMGLELAEEGEGEDIVAQLTAMEKGEMPVELEGLEDVGPTEAVIEREKGPGLKEPEWLTKELEAANAEVDAWLKKHGAEESEEIELDADLSSLLTTAEKEVEDYLIEKNLSFEDES
jgi:hypothetical protein